MKKTLALAAVGGLVAVGLVACGSPGPACAAASAPSSATAAVSTVGFSSSFRSGGGFRSGGFSGGFKPSGPKYTAPKTYKAPSSGYKAPTGGGVTNHYYGGGGSGPLLPFVGGWLLGDAMNDSEACQ